MNATVRVPIAIPTVRLPAHEVHIWQAHLDRASLSELAQLLSEEEMSRAQRCRFAVDRNRSIAARGILREILSTYLGTPAAALAFSTGPFGKPFLPHHPLHFNLSHSGPMMLIALSRQEVGIDLEKTSTPVEVMPIAQACFSPEQTAELSTLPATARVFRFFQIWTSKEALAKASGRGIAQLQDAGLQTTWTPRPIEAPAGYVAALASLQPHSHYTLHYRAWN